MKTPSQTRSCLFCGKIAAQHHLLVNHMSTHTKEKSFFCNKCPKEERTFYKLAKHLAMEHGKPLQFLCVFCDKRFVKQHELEYHMYHHTKEKWFECNKCPKIFSTSSWLQKHRKTHSNRVLAYKCKVCNTKSSTKRDIERHQMAIHGLGGSWKCPHCPANCFSQWTLDEHLRKHTGEKPFKCDKCPKRFARKVSLKRHMVTHVDSYLKDLVCNQCGSQLHSKAGLLRHYKIHSMPYKCEVCDKKFPRKDALQTHIYSHTGERPYKCKLCSKTYKDRKHLNSHYNNFHGLKQRQ